MNPKTLAMLAISGLVGDPGGYDEVIHGTYVVTSMNPTYCVNAS